MRFVSRKKKLSIVIGNDLTITVEIRGDKVRLRIVGPKSMPVSRIFQEDVWLAIRYLMLFGETPPTPECPEPAVVPVSDRNIAFLDRLAAASEKATGSPVSPSVALQRILDAVEDIGAALDQKLSLEELILLLTGRGNKKAL